MKALTVCQPHAHFIAHGPKRVENRTWSTKYRGPLLIHAGKSLRYFQGTTTADIFARYRLPPPPNEGPRQLVFGAALAVCNLVDCVRVEDLTTDHPGVCPVSFVEGPWCWVLDDVQALEEPLPMTGAQGLFAVPPAMLAHLPTPVPV